MRPDLYVGGINIPFAYNNSVVRYLNVSHSFLYVFLNAAYGHILVLVIMTQMYW